MHSLGRATLVVGSETPAGDGVTGALRCVITDQNGKRFSAYLKTGPIEEIMSEALTALIFSGWGLPVPAPYLVQRDAELCFASADVTYPSLKKRFNLASLPTQIQNLVAEQVSRIVCSFTSTPLAAACDEAVGNHDRNLGNVLWDGTQEVWIDHAYCFGTGNQPDVNKLCAMAVAVHETERMQRSALAAALLLDRSTPTRVATEISATSLDVAGMIDYVDGRLQQIGQLILSRFPQPRDLLAPR